MTTQAQQALMGQAVAALLADTRETPDDRRTEKRQPFFTPVTVLVEEEGQQRNYSCFSRDLSERGIGLLHNMPLNKGQATLRLPRKSGQPVILQGEIVWCRPCGEGWFLSGVNLLGVQQT